MHCVVYYYHVVFALSFKFVVALKSQIVTVDGVGKRVGSSPASFGLTEDDIIENKIMLASFGTLMKTEATPLIGKWDNGRIPYAMDKAISENAEKVLAIRKAFNLLHSHTCIRFVPRKNEADFVLFVDRGVARCSSYVGKIGGAQELSVGDGCERMVGVIVHEMVHAIGFPHEQSRWDRDRYVTVQWDAIREDKQRNFLTIDQSMYGGDGIPYDYASVMHYHQAAFSKDGQATIITKDKLAQDVIGQRDGLSGCDLAKINKRYKCPVMKGAPECVGGSVGPVPVTCVDKYPMCSLAKADASYCDNYPGIYKRLCDQTCNGCDGPQCVDSTVNNKQCQEIRKDLRKCELDVMARIVCPKSCGVCV